MAEDEVRFYERPPMRSTGYYRCTICDQRTHPYIEPEGLRCDKCGRIFEPADTEQQRAWLHERQHQWYADHREECLRNNKLYRVMRYRKSKAVTP